MWCAHIKLRRRVKSKAKRSVSAVGFTVILRCLRPSPRGNCPYSRGLWNDTGHHVIGAKFEGHVDAVTVHARSICMCTCCQSNQHNEQVKSTPGRKQHWYKEEEQFIARTERFIRSYKPAYGHNCDLVDSGIYLLSMHRPTVAMHQPHMGLETMDAVMQRLLLVSWKGLQTADELQSLQSLRQLPPDGAVVMYAWA